MNSMIKLIYLCNQQCFYQNRLLWIIRTHSLFIEVIYYHQLTPMRIMSHWISQIYCSIHISPSSCMNPNRNILLLIYTASNFYLSLQSYLSFKFHLLSLSNLIFDLLLLTFLFWMIKYLRIFILLTLINHPGNPNNVNHFDFNHLTFFN